MTERHSVRDVKHAFEQILEDNRVVANDIDLTIHETQGHIAAVEGLYTRALDKFVTAQIRPMNSEMLGILSRIAVKRDFEEEYKDNVAAARGAEIRLNGLVATHGEEMVLKRQLQALSHESYNLGGENLKLAASIDKLSKALKPVDAFNEKADSAGKPKLDAEQIGYFSSKRGLAHVWAWLFDGHYRQGRALMHGFEKAGETIPDVQRTLAGSKAEKERKDARLDEMSAEAGRVEAVLKDMRETAEKALSEQVLRERLKKDIMASFDDIGFFNRAAKRLGDKFPVFVTEQRAKLENLRKIERAARQSRDAVQQAGAKLDKHMPKLRRAASRSGSTRMTIDLDGIRSGFAGMQSGVRTQSSQMRRAGSAVRDYKFSAAPQAPAAAVTAPGGLDPVFFMAVVMMSDIGPVAGVPDVAVPGNAGDIGGSFNSAALDNIDVGRIDVTVPDISVSVPDISVPDVSSYGGGYDGGGFSGGFDGGGF